jgi:hypothetical protein
MNLYHIYRYDTLMIFLCVFSWIINEFFNTLYQAYKGGLLWRWANFQGQEYKVQWRPSGKPLKFTLLHVSICSKFVRNFSNTLGFVSLCCYASLLNYDIFIQPGTPSNWSKCQMYNNNENWSYLVSDIYT